MRILKIFVSLAAIVVLGICIYTFFATNFKNCKFESNEFGWYFLAKGIFCSLSLYLSVRVLEVLTIIKDKLRQ